MHVAILHLYLQIHINHTFDLFMSTCDLFLSFDIIIIAYNITHLNLIMLNIEICTEQTYAVIVLINKVHIYVNLIH